MGRQARRALEGASARRVVTYIAPPLARPAQPKGWLATLGVLLLMIGIVGAG